MKTNTGRMKGRGMGGVPGRVARWAAMMTAIIIGGARVGLAQPVSGGDDQNKGQETGGFLEGFSFGDEGAAGEVQPPATPPGGANDKSYHLVFNTDTTVADIIPLLAELSGKPVRPASNILNTKIALVNGGALTAREAYDLLGITLFETEPGIAVIDRGSYLVVTMMTQIQRGANPITDSDEDFLARTDLGMIATRVYPIRYGTAKNIADSLRAEVFNTEMKVAVDEQSNQIVATYNIGTLQHLQRLIDRLDTKNQSLQLETFQLRYSDASAIAQLIISLYSAEEDQSQQGGGFNRGGGFFQPARGQGGDAGGVATTSSLRVVADKQHNTVTVLAEREVLEQIREQISEVWDRPFAVQGMPTKIYELKASDAVKMRDLLLSLFQADESAVEVMDFNMFQQGGQQRGRAGGGGSTAAESPNLHPLAGQVAVEADEDKNRLIVTARSQEYFPLLDQLIESLDQASDANLPVTYELKYANAEELAEQLNSIFAEFGTSAVIRRTEEGLTATEEASPFGETTTGTTTGGTTQEAQNIVPWWNQAQRPENERSISSLISHMRIVPIRRQNSLLVLAPIEHRGSIDKMIEALDRPGRQVLIQGIVAEITYEDATAVGIRWGSGNSIFNDANPDNQIRILSNVEGTKNNLIDALFDTSVLEATFDLNAALQILNETTDLNIISQPRVFTSDNEEAQFFDGQDFPFITDTQISDTGQVVNSFTYKAVGIRLGVRPHITVEGNVDLRVNLELSSIVPGQTLFGGFIVDRRETTTKVTIRDQQTVVISGIFREQESDILRKIPLLGDLPILGAVFRSREVTKQKREIVAFIRPIIMNNVEEGNNQSSRDSELLHQIEQQKGMEAKPKSGVSPVTGDGGK